MQYMYLNRITHSAFKLAITAVLSLLLSSCFSETTSTRSTDKASVTDHLLSSTSVDSPTMVVYKSPTCGCCQAWVDYVENAGFSVSAINHDDVDTIKTKHGLTNPSLKSCHTAIVEGYVIEGHVPVSDIERLLAERPDIVGLTAPGMPMMSPGMGSEIPKDYDVLAFDEQGNSQIFSSY